MDLALDDPEISRQHAAIEVAGERVTVIDLGSANGVQVGDQSVAEAPLENQAEFTVGRLDAHADRDARPLDPRLG